jgi:peptidyl-tRNA hydrolase, PTH1 family
MKLIIGLGNPGPKYARNRHNIGYLAVEAIANAHGLGLWRSKFQGALLEARFPTGKALLLKPETFMNLSGGSVQAAMAFYKLATRDIIVLHDELDLAPGKVRGKVGGGHAGHNGLRSIMGHIGPDFARLRLGIGHPGDKALVSNYVLGDFAKSDDDWLNPLLAAIGKSASDLVAGDLNRVTASVGQATTRPGPTAQAVTPAPTGTPNDERTSIQRLVDRFR